MQRSINDTFVTLLPFQIIIKLVRTYKYIFCLFKVVKSPHELPCKQVSNRVILALSRILLSWKFIGRALDLDESDLEHIRVDYPNDCREQSYKMLLLWKQRQPQNATYQVLGQVLQGEDRDVYRQYVKIVTSHSSL